MTPKEKADELIGKFSVGGWSKEHAMTCVNEIIKQADNWGVVSVKGYWQQVKTEIENQ